MGSKKPMKKGEFSQFCFCLGLRTGVIISSALWMIEGIVFSTLLITRKVTESTTSSIYNNLLIVQIIYFIILSLTSAIGLTSLIIYKSTPILRMYSYISLFFAVFINSVLAIVTLIVRKGYNYDPLWLAVFLFFQSFLHLYFSIILRAYIKGKKLNSSKNSLNNHGVFNIKVDKTFDVRNQIV